MFVGIDDVVPDEEADGEEHGCVQVFPVRIGPPSMPVFSTCYQCRAHLWNDIEKKRRKNLTVTRKEQNHSS